MSLHKSNSALNEQKVRISGGRIPSVIKALNCISKFPKEILDLIKDFAFYHLDAEHIIQIIKKKKDTIINSFTVSRITYNYNPLDEHWRFNHSYVTQPIYFIGCNCVKCGNFKESHYSMSAIYYRFIPDKIKCTCKLEAQQQNEPTEAYLEAKKTKEQKEAYYQLILRKNMTIVPIDSLFYVEKVYDIFNFSYN